MIKAKKENNSIIKFGKLPAQRDIRNLKLSAILRAPVKLPAEYDFDVKNHGIPTPMFGNDEYGDCVIAGRAHQTLRFEKKEQRKVLKITEKEVLREYFKETGGDDSGLNVLDSLKLWRKRGWKAAGKKYTIKAFAEINRTKRDEVKRTVFMDIGVGLGFTLPDAAINQFHAGKPWEIVSGPSSRPNPDNGHYVYVPGYTKKGPVCVTWGRKQQMTWAFMMKYCDEAYAIIDAVNTAKKKKIIDEMKLKAFLAKI